MLGFIFMASAASSPAANLYQFSTSFDSAQAQGGPHPVGIAVDNSTSSSDPSRGDIYVTDGSVVNKFTPASAAAGNSTPDAQLTASGLTYAYGITVDPTNGDVYVTNVSPAGVFKFNAAGEQQPFAIEGVTIGAAGGITVNPSNGDILVGDLSNYQIYELDAAGVDSGNTYAGYNSPEGLAFDSSGHLYNAQNQITVFDTESCTSVCGPSRVLTSNGGPHGVAVDPETGDVFVSERSQIVEFNESGEEIGEVFGSGHFAEAYGVATDIGASHVYVADNPANDAVAFTALNVPDITVGLVTNEAPTSATLNGHVAPSRGEVITDCHFEYGVDTSYSLGSVPCSPAAPYSSPADVSANLNGLTSETSYHYRLVATDGQGTNLGKDHTFTPHAVGSLHTEPPTNLAVTHTDLNGSFVGNGEDTHYSFEWGTSKAYGNATPETDAHSPTGPNATQLSYELTGLSPVTTYHYRIIASNSNGVTVGEDQEFTTLPFPPVVVGEALSDIHSDSALLHGQVNPNSGDTAYHFEYGSADCAVSSCSATANVDVGSGTSLISVSSQLGSLKPSTTYHWRLVATSPGGTTAGPDRIFTTYPYTPLLNDPCSNAHVRQQTGAAQLLDCRAYELVSAANSGGYDVESDLVPGEAPYASYPDAQNPARVLYAVHGGGIPGTGSPTDRGPDPYIATRGENGWTTEYVGVPATNPFSTAPFSSSPSEADAGLDTLSFGGEGGCSPCFADGSTGVPVRTSNGSLIQGMAGSLSQPAAEPAGFIGRHLSADGNHFIFGSTSKFEPDGNQGEISIYDRNLSTDVTHVVSKTPGGQTMTGPGIGELDISSDGSRVLIGQLVSEAEGAKHWHLYMDVGDSTHSIDLTPGTTSGVVYDGMSADGSKVYFTTSDKLATASNQDTDESPDIYLAEVSDSAATLSRVSTGSAGAGNTDSCEPVANTAHEHWNTSGPEENCGVVAIGGGGGVASGDGTIYFLSPERLDGPANGVQNAPNLYVARPGSAPRYVATLESDLTGPQPPLTYHPLLRSAGNFTEPRFVAVDTSGGPSNGDIYVADTSTNTVFKLNSSGQPVTGWGGNGQLSITPGFNINGIAVGPTGKLYVAAGNCETFEFDQDSSPVFNFKGQCAEQDGIAVDSVGNVYTINGGISRFSSSGENLGGLTSAGGFTGLFFDPKTDAIFADLQGQAVDRYAFNGSNEVIEPSSIPCSTGCEPTNTVVTALSGANGVAVDFNHDLYVDEGAQVREFDSTGKQIGVEIGSGLLSGSFNVAVDSSGNLFVGNPKRGDIAEFGPSRPKPDPSTDSPTVINAVSSPEVRHTADFQVAPSGDFAAFPTTLPLNPEFDNAGHVEVYRYNAAVGRLDCVSCNPTGLEPVGDASLASSGASLINDGRVFFTTLDALTARDNDSRKDVYEWEPEGIGSCERSNPTFDKTVGACIELISSGTSPFDSSLLGASSDGTDVYFFTHDSLTPQSQGGHLVKIYDARVHGGLPYVPPPVPCKASDECHGAGTPTPPPPLIDSGAGKGGNRKVTGKIKCRTRAIKKHGKCGHRGSKHHRGGGK